MCKLLPSNVLKLPGLIFASLYHTSWKRQCSCSVSFVSPLFLSKYVVGILVQSLRLIFRRLEYSVAAILPTPYFKERI